MPHFRVRRYSKFFASAIDLSLNGFEAEHQPTWSLGAQSKLFLNVDISLALNPLDINSGGRNASFSVGQSYKDFYIRSREPLC
jgi:hypothetical protein